MTDDEEKFFEEVKVCHLCDKPFTPTKLKTRDGCVVPGKYRGAAHRGCRMRFDISSLILPVVFHNLWGYDNLFIMGEIGAIVKHQNEKEPDKKKHLNISCIPNNMEK